jgi:hypothetical protein
MDTSRSLYHFLCEDQDCFGLVVVEYVPPIKVNSGYRPEISDRPACPLCGGDMMIIPMAAGDEETIPDPGWPDEIQTSVTLYTRRVFVPDVNSKVHRITPASSAKVDQDSAAETSSIPEKNHFTEEELARHFDVEVVDIRRLVAKRKLSYVQLKVGKRVFTQESIDDFIRRESGVAAPPVAGGKNPLAPKPRQSISLEESRRILREALKKS